MFTHEATLRKSRGFRVREGPWFVRDDAGSPASMDSSGRRSAPYWSTAARAKRAAELWGGNLRVEPMTLDHWRDAELPVLAQEQLLVGINWSGPRLVGWSFTVPEVINRLIHALGESSSGRTPASG
ncbi:DUF2750 domain-containing protein [Actinacidiphila glaucinigra]|uniref:DUF2750 domain-containing protein n=1 Tax=Actinacidiphila glaucinigra TaxID=235986 RepID=UPI0038652748